MTRALGSPVPRMVDANELVSSGDVAAMLGVSRQTMSNWKQRGIVMPEPVAQIAHGKTDVYLRSDWEAFKVANLEATTHTVYRLKKEA